MPSASAAVMIAVDNDADEPAVSPEAERENLRMVEALLFAAAEPLAAEEIAGRLPEGADVPGLLSEL
jgi:segregation and condensation protein B